MNQFIFFCCSNKFFKCSLHFAKNRSKVLLISFNCLIKISIELRASSFFSLFCSLVSKLSPTKLKFESETFGLSCMYLIISYFCFALNTILFLFGTIALGRHSNFKQKIMCGYPLNAPSYIRDTSSKNIQVVYKVSEPKFRRKMQRHFCNCYILIQ